MAPAVSQHNHQTHNQNNKFYQFFDLPRELRDQILEEICHFPNGVVVHHHYPIASPVSAPADVLIRQYMNSEGKDDDDASETESEDEGSGGGGRLKVTESTPPVNLFLAGSDELFQSAMKIYYGRNTFHLDSRRMDWIEQRGTKRPDMEKRFGRVQGLLVNSGRGRIMIRSLAIYGKRISTIARLVPELKEMVLRASLRRLEINVLEVARRSLNWEARWRGTMCWRGDLTKTETFKQLVGLLADPDFEMCKMRVGKDSHNWVWCQFHEEGNTEKEEHSVETYGAYGEKERKILACRPSYTGDRLSSNDWLEIDVPKLVKRCGGDAAEFKVVKVNQG